MRLRLRVAISLVAAACTLWAGTGSLQAQSGGVANPWPDEATCRTSASDNPTVKAWCIAIDTRRGNCVACHAFNVTPWPEGLPAAGNIAPPMVAMQGRFPDRDVLTQVIGDATAFNARSSMPPYLRHGILSEREIDLLVDFLLGL